MRPLAFTLALAVLGAAAPARAEQDDEYFTKKPYVWKEDDRDKRLLNTKLMKSMETGFKNPGCARVAASLLAAFAEATPYFHKKDNRFAIFKVFTDPITTDKFPADDYLVHMLHRAMIDGKAPEAWLTAAKALKSKYKAPIDLARLAYAVDGPTLIDSIDFGFVVFLQKYQAEVLLAPTVAQASALERFQDRYLDRDFAWSGLILADIHKEVPPPKPKPKLKKGQKPPPVDEDDEDAKPKYYATLLVPQNAPVSHPIFQTRAPEPMRIIARLLPEQYIDLKKVVVTEKFLVRGRFYGFRIGSGKKDEPPVIVEVRDALLFEDHDWTNYAGFADANDVAACDIAINDLSPLGLKDVQGVGDRDGFSH